MSFSYDVKRELAKIPLGKKTGILAECYGILLYCNTFSVNEIRVITGNGDFAARLPKLFKRAFGFSFDSVTCAESGKTNLVINDADKLHAVFDTFGYSRDQFLAHHINFIFVEDEICQAAFLRGAFFAGGSVIDPKKRYHLELVTDHCSVCREMHSILLDMGFVPKDTSRGGNYITYFKQSDVIADILTKIGAPISAMEIIQEKIEKQMKNEVMRQVNCDTSNVKKTVNAAQVQIDAIKTLESHGALLTLPPKLLETARLRVDNPELSLSDLAQMSDPPVTKSCINHRMRSILERASEYE